jgi:hypothetical protein
MNWVDVNTHCGGSFGGNEGKGNKEYVRAYRNLDKVKMTEAETLEVNTAAQGQYLAAAIQFVSILHGTKAHLSEYLHAG